MKRVDLTNVQEASNGGDRLPAGGYVCRYTNVTDQADKEYLYMEFDIAEGQYKDYYKKLEEAMGFWGGRCYRSYKPAALPMFKRMCSAVGKSNPGFVFDGGDTNADESTLKGKLIGIIFGEEEYIGNDGSLKTRLYVKAECDVTDIRANKFKVPALKKLPEEQRPAETQPIDEFVNVDEGEDGEVPFC